MSPSGIAKAVGRSVPRVINVLAALRLAEVVRHETVSYFRNDEKGKMLRDRLQWRPGN